MADKSLRDGWLKPWVELPRAITDAALLHTADTIGVAVAASRAEAGTLPRSLAERYPQPDGASVIGRSTKTDPVAAAFANATMAHSLDFDDGHEFLHPGSAVVMACLAVAEVAGSSGEMMLRGVVYGYGVACRLAELLGVEHRRRAFHPTGTCSAVGAAVGACLAMGGDADQALAALDIATTAASGICAYRLDGADTKSFNAGLASRNGVTAALLAMGGAKAPANSIGSPYGFLRAMGDMDAEAARVSVLQDLEQAITECYVKPYPSCRRTHSAITAAIVLHENAEIDPAQITSVRIDTFERACEPWLTRWRAPETRLDAMLCMPICVATALVDGQVTVDALAPERTNRPEVVDLARSVVVSEDPAYTAGHPASAPARVVAIAGGKEFRAEADTSGLGQPIDPAMVRRKFALNVGASAGMASGSDPWSLVQHLPGDAAVGDLIHRLCGRTSL